MIMDFRDIERMIKNTAGDMTPSYWGNALAGEVGESCNLIKKFERDGVDNTEELALELADVFIYCVLTTRVFGIDFEKAILDKLRELKEKYPDY